MHQAGQGEDVAGLRTLVASLRTVTPPSWLRDAVDPATLSEALRERIGEVVPGAAELAELRLRDVRARRSWALRIDATVVTHEGPRTAVLVAQVPPPGSPADRPPGALEVRSLGMTVRAADGEDDLPALRTLTSPEPARDLLQAALREAHPGSRLEQVRSRPVRHKPGRRATLVCDLEWGAGANPSAPRRVVAKVYRDDAGASTYAWMGDLWDSPLRDAALPRLAAPLGYLPEARTLLQQALPGGSTLADLLADRDRPDDSSIPAALRAAGEGLAALHGSGVTTGPRRTADVELATAAELLARLEPTFPDRAGEVRELLASLGRFLGEGPPDPVPVHGAFRPAQVLLDDGRPGFLDFDGFGRGEAALDLGRFLARLEELARARPEARRRDLAGAFLDGYRAGTPLDLDRVARWVVLDLALGAVRSWYRGGFERATDLLDQAAEVLDRPW